MIRLLVLLFFSVFVVSADTVFTYMAKEDVSDPRKDYNIALLKLALEKTVPMYGSYTLVSSQPMNYARARKEALNNTIPNFFFKNSVSQDYVTNLGYIPFPVDRGIVGYRVFFVSPAAKEKLTHVTTIEALKGFSFIQGLGWLDTQILQYHGFNVLAGSSYRGLFGMVAKNRIDLFPRGANELLYEYENYKEIEGLTYDTTLTLYYPLPRFFFTNKKNVQAIKRIHEGILMAYKDGSLVTLWNKYYKESIDFVALDKRKILKLENPFLEGVDRSYEKYIYQPNVLLKKKPN